MYPSLISAPAAARPASLAKALLLFGLSLALGAAAPVQAQLAVPGELSLPKASRSEWVYQQGQKVWLQLSGLPVETVLLHYLALSRKPGWKLTFPAEAEAAAWLEALERSRESKVFMLNLYHLKTKVNYVLTVGELSDTSRFSARSITTIYSRQRPFGR